MKRFWSRRDFLFESCGGLSGLALAHLLNQDGLLAATVYLIRRRPAPAATGGAGTGPAEMTLAERYARGEINAEEYRRRQAVLREHHDQGPGS